MVVVATAAGSVVAMVEETMEPETETEAARAARAARAVATGSFPEPSLGHS